MKDEEIEKLSLDDTFDENEFMLNDNSSKKEVVKIDYYDDKTVPLEELVVPEMPKSRELRNANVMEENRKEENKPKKQRIKKEKVKKERTKKEKKSKGFKIPGTKKGKRIFLLQAIFCSLSIIFVLGCSIFYGSRLIKYYRIYNPKTEGGEKVQLIGSSITDNATYTTTGEGLYKLGGASVYKGSNVNNYIRFANLMWRIVSVNTDGSLEIVLDDNINALSFNAKASSFKDSDINKYLNNKFINALNKDYLSTTSICLDDIEDIANITCNNTDSEAYVRLLGVSELLNSKVDGKTYLANNDGYWLYNQSKKGAWHVSGSSLADSDVTNGYLVKPVIRIKNSAQLLGGTGTSEDPYYIEKENTNLEIGNYVKLGNDTWIIYDANDTTVTMALDSNLSTTYRFSTASNKYDPSVNNSIAYYLNNTYLNSLTYKDKINNNDWYIGGYNYMYESTSKLKINTKVGMYNVSDLKIGNSEETYYLMTPSKTNYVYLYNSYINESRVTLVRNIKPTININKLKVLSGKGTKNDPYVLEV